MNDHQQGTIETIEILRSELSRLSRLIETPFSRAQSDAVFEQSHRVLRTALNLHQDVVSLRLVAATLGYEQNEGVLSIVRRRVADVHRE